ncbi:MAG: hypothetical protein JW762_06025 [Dehalococcoidales bacterium]|nr:hypothetical protein [Dehalococcoidales bacterium]
MELEGLLQEIFSFTGSFNIQLILVLFFVCAIGEVALMFIPYLLETVWLLFGYNLGTGELTTLQLVFLWLAALAGRQAGGAILYFIGQFGSVPIKKIYQRYFESRISKKFSGNNSVKRLGNINFFSPFSVASGRLFGLRIPLTLALGAAKKYRSLFLGILLSSMVWDGIYILGGLAGGKTALEPVQMMLYSLIGLTGIYVITFVIRLLWRRLHRTQTG